MRDLRVGLKAHLFDFSGASSLLCSLGWQGDFGKGISTGSGVYSDPGVNPWILYGPVAAGATSVQAFQAGYGSGAIPQIQWRPGMVARGDYETEWVYCRLSVSGPADLMPGQAWQIDENYTATLLLTSAVVLNANVGVSYLFAPATATGVFYGWLCRAGNVLVRAAASSIATGMAESSATAGLVKFVNSHTSGAMTVGPFQAWGASSSITFKADTVSGSPILLNVTSQIAVNGLTPGGAITDLMPGMVFTGTGAPSNAIISAIDQKGPGGSYRAFIGTNTTGAQNTAQNASATNLQTTFTCTNMVAASLNRPTETTQN